MKSQIDQAKSTSHLIEDVKKELSKAGYKPATIQVYQRYWNVLLQYGANNGIKLYSPKFGLDFNELVGQNSSSLFPTIH